MKSEWSSGDVVNVNVSENEKTTSTVTDRTWEAIKPVFDRFEKRGQKEVPGSALRYAILAQRITAWSGATSLSRLVNMGVLTVVRDTPSGTPGVSWRRTYWRGEVAEVASKKTPVWQGGLSEVDTEAAQLKAKGKPFSWVKLPQRVGDLGMTELESLGFEVTQVIRWTGESEGNSEVSK
jgi:hypothetical protein